MNRDSMKALYESGGEQKFAISMINNIHNGKIKVDDINITALWKAMGEPQLKPDHVIGNRLVNSKDFKEAMSTSAFPKITGALINKKVQEAYDLEYGIGDMLVTKVQSSVKDETIVGFGADNAMKEVAEGIDYEEGSITEKYHKIKNVKFGRIISLTKEMVAFDQTGQMMLRAQQIGEAAKSSRELTIMNAVLELTSTGLRAAWRPAGVATTLYSNTSTDPYSSATLDNLGGITLADETDLAEALALFSQFTDEQGLPMRVTPKILLSGLSLKAIANQICYSGQAVKLTTPDGVKNIFTGTQALDTTFIDQQLATTSWFYGDFKKQFVYTEVWPLQVEQQGRDSEQSFNADVISRYKVGYYGGCGAVSNRYVVKGNT